MDTSGAVARAATPRSEGSSTMHRGQDNRGRVRLVGTGGAEVSSDEPQGAAETWARVKRRLRAELGEDVFASWFARLEMDAVGEGCARLSVPTRFLKSWIEAHYADRVLSVYRSEAPDLERISIGVRGSHARDGAAAAKMSDAPRLVTGTSAEAPNNF